nr:heat shock protein 90-like [Lepeophtheirus salmonis]
MSIIVNSLYTNKEYSIKELISNASDALDKYLSLFKSEESEPKTSFDDLKIKIKVNEENKTIEISDNGIGMTKKDLEEFLGSIASSGTRKFKEQMETSGNASSNLNTIGQFGLGFYSAFIISSTVELVTRSPGHEQFKWSSNGVEDYTIEPMEPDREHGTTITLNIKEGNEEFLKNQKIEGIIKKHSSFICYPIYIEEMPIWTKNPKTVTPEEYKGFYKNISNDWQDHLAVKHVSIDGTHKFDFVLFIPKSPPSSIFERSKKFVPNIKLYCAKVLITDDLSDIIPDWMSFIVGTISNDNLPINVSREFLQGKETFRVMKRVLIKKTIEMLTEIMQSDKAKEFYEQYSEYIKYGIREEDSGNRNKLADLLRYKTSKSENPTTFSEYIGRMVEGQKQILVLTGTSIESILKSPFLKAYNEYEIFFMGSPIDEVMLQSFNKYGDYPIQRIDSHGVDIKTESNEDLINEFKPVAEKVKTLLDLESVNVKELGERIPAIVSSSQFGQSPAMRKIMQSQPGGNANNPMVMMMQMSKNILTISPSSTIVQRLKTLSENEESKDQFEKFAKVLYSTALLDSGFPLQNYDEHAKMVYELMSSSSN